MHSDVFSVIADPTRRRIVRILAEQTHTVGAVVEKLGMSQPTISKHLKVLRDADVVSVTVEGQRRLYSLNPEVFATVTEWINETVQIARRASEAPVALPGGATLSSAHAPDEKAEAAPTSVTEPGAEKAPEKVAESQTAETLEEKPAEQSVAEAQPTAEELEQERIRRARAQYITPTARIIARPAHPASADAAPAVVNAATRDAGSRTESAQDSAVPAIAAHEDAVDSTPMRPFTPASYGYDVGRTALPEAQAVPPASAEPAKAEEKPVDKAESPAVTVSSGYGFDSASSYGIDPAAVVGGSVQPIVEENVAEENTAEEGSSERSEEATVAAPAVEPAEDSAENREATEKAPGQVEGSEETPEESEAAPVEPAQSEPEYQTMPAYNSAYAPAQEPKEKEHRGGLFGFLRGRRR
ncbi:metalloregulator ArsR/SmtB family transcription factor [uncultured Rothia sp.]|uniref:metalloregulator ArsR/SmtB family transcription factor n=1 Tax=uncultured Rothia sp. TaxID=316088 RepID=UPI0025FA7A97|nr:metalloregulator ArsR/SmtB family transcription factor [uncultured Rothia sp.]